MDKLRIACVGAGSALGARSSTWLGVINQLGDMFDHCAIMDLSEAHARASAAEFGIREVYTNLDDLFEQGRPDLIVRLTPTDSSYAVCMAAAEAGVHILSEIPIDFSLARADGMVAKCREKGVVLDIAENVWTWPTERLKKQIVDAGVIGEVTHLRLSYPCGAYHGFSTIRKLVCSEAVRVLGYDGKVPVVNLNSYGGEAMSETMWDGGVIEFAGGPKCLFEMPPKRPVWRMSWMVEGTRGFIKDDLVIDDPEALRGKTSESEMHFPIETVYAERDSKPVLEAMKVETDPPVVWENPYAKYGIDNEDDVSKATYLEGMYRAIVEGKPVVYGPDEARRDMELWIGLRESAWRGSEWLDLPLRETTSVEEAMHEEFRRRYGCEPMGDVEKQLRMRYDRTPVMWKVVGWL